MQRLPIRSKSYGSSRAGQCRRVRPRRRGWRRSSVRESAVPFEKVTGSGRLSRSSERNRWAEQKGLVELRVREGALGSAAVRLHEAVATDWLRLEPLRPECGDHRPPHGDRLLNRGKTKRGFVALLAFPDFGDPDGVRIRWISGDDVAEAARHPAHALHEHLDERVALALSSLHLTDQTVHVSRCAYGEKMIRFASESGASPDQGGGIDARDSWPARHTHQMSAA